MEPVTSSYSIDPHSETWRAIEFWITQRLNIRRSTLEISGLPIDETENARGALEELNELQQLVGPHAVVDTAAEDG